MDSINAIELSDEQLDAVTGGDQTNDSGSVNIAAPGSLNVVAGSWLAGSPVGSSVIPQTNITSQSNSKSTGCCYYPSYYCC